MEPWLDSLSDEWASNKQSSSPGIPTSAAQSRPSSRASSHAQSRIPHLSQNCPQNSTSGSFLRPRSSKGLSRAQNSPILAERTWSKQNVVANKANLDGRSTLPRRASSAFSGSVNSVQHHTIQPAAAVGDENTPEWKRRLARGEDVGVDGCDLFGPIRLEGVFKPPSSLRSRRENVSQSAVQPVKPWSMPEQYQSMRASRTRIPGMEVLAEEEENEVGSEMSGTAEGSARRRALSGIVRDRVLSLEHDSMTNSLLEVPEGSLRMDSRMRTSSGLEEIQNETISPITSSRQNTIRERALQRLTDASTRTLQSKLEDIAERPPSRSSDDGVMYGHDRRDEQDIGEVTSLSLPDDLSMGTQDFVTRGGFVNSRRGGRSNDGSFQKKTLSSSIAPSIEQSTADLKHPPFPSSPPSYSTTDRHSRERPSEALISPTTPKRPQDSDSTDRPRSSGSPLKLFGNYDTFTNDKLLRRMSQFAHNDRDVSTNKDEHSRGPDDQEDLRLSHFGKGDLDNFTFNENVKRQPATAPSCPPTDTRIFDLSVIDERNLPCKEVPEALSLQRQKELRPDENTCQNYAADSKRASSSTVKDRNPKRRRTLLQSEADVRQDLAVRDESGLILEATQLAGKKRKDARYDVAGLPADPVTLASRTMLHPRTTQSRASTVAANDNPDEEQGIETGKYDDKLAEELASELASFGIGMTQIASDSRKPSVTTQDFLNEATKIMQIIRQRGKPKSGLSSVEEPHDEAQINPDSILDLDVEGEDTTVDKFSRPPSRNGSMKLRREGIEPPDPRVISHLQKYQDGDDLDLLITSKLGSLHLLPEAHAKDATLVPLPDDEDEVEENLSSPVNIRIRNSMEPQRKRKHSTSTVGGPASLPTHSSSGTLTGTTIPTCSSASSGNKGRIAPGMVLVPEQVGIMTFDHSTKSWVRGKGPRPPTPASARKTNSEEDPFGDIPDLSIDEQKEAARNSLPSQNDYSSQEKVPPPIARPVDSSRPQTREGAQIQSSETTSAETKFTRLDSTITGAETRTTSWATADIPHRSKDQTAQLQLADLYADHDEEVEHEIRIHDGRASKAPPSPHRLSRKARAVTIAFSSPLVSAIAYHDESTLSDMQEAIPTDYMEREVRSNSYLRPDGARSQLQSSAHGRDGAAFTGRLFAGRPVSRIDEEDEDAAVPDLSVVHVSQPKSMTPARRSNGTRAVTNSKHQSIICLTPLSEFSLHQVDRPLHLETSYVAHRAHPTSLQQAHGSLSLAVEDLMKAITDAEPYELYWEHIRRLDLADKRLTTLHRLDEYCSAIEELYISRNELCQLSGVPASVRTLFTQNNCLSSLTSWGHLQNLQYLDMSENALESLDGLSCLVHLRELKANNNRIRNLEGILDLNGLLHLELQNNELVTVDFEGGEFTRLHHLDLSNNQLTTVSSIEALPALRTLYLEKNHLRTFGAPNRTYPMLRDLRLSFNHLEIIDLANTPSIETIYLDNNEVHSLLGLATARHLNTLSIREQANSPKLLNTILSTSNECRKLYLSSNCAPPEGLKMSPLPHLNLKLLELGSCGLTSLPDDFGKKIPNCRTLNLNFNAVKDLAPLKGCDRLNKLMVAGNRLNKLRRTCMALTRLSALTKIDLRDNPLTVGFYPPFRESRLVVRGQPTVAVQDPYTLRSLDHSLDSRWITHLDEGTRMKRRTIELFLAKGCEQLVELNGLVFDRSELLQQDEVWQKLASMGIISKASRHPLGSHEPNDDEPLPLDAEGNGTVHERERSLSVE